MAVKKNKDVALEIDIKTCSKCNTTKKHLFYVNSNTKTRGMCTECKCGIIDKKGVKVA